LLLRYEAQRIIEAPTRGGGRGSGRGLVLRGARVAREASAARCEHKRRQPRKNSK
jgi:hypothetical protein